MKKFLLFLVVLGGLTAGVAYYSNQALVGDLPNKGTNTNLTQIVTVQHPSWKDELIPLESNRARRKNGPDQGQIQNVTPSSFEVVWDRWGIETYTLNPETGIYHLSAKRPK